MARPEHRYNVRDAQSDFNWMRVRPQPVVEATLDPEIGGSTTYGQTGEPARQGISVALGGHEETVSVDDFGVSDVHRYTHTPEHIRQLTAGPKRALGTWVEGRNVYMDVARVHPDTERGRRIARTAMVGNDQISGFDLGSFTTEYNPVKEDVLKRAGGNVELMPGEANRYTTSTAPWGSEVVYGWTTEDQPDVPAGQGTFIFTGPGSQLQLPPDKS